MKRFIDVASLAETEAFGRRLAIAEGLDVKNPHQVTSPTFVLIQEYEARLPIYHFDAYRLKNEAEFADLGVHEYFQGNGVCLVEWADKVPGCLPEELLTIKISVTGLESRRLELEARGDKYKILLANPST